MDTMTPSFRSLEYLKGMKYWFGSENIFIQFCSGLIILVSTQISSVSILWIYKKWKLRVWFGLSILMF